MKLLDACQQWLGISPAERPITHYRMLGIANFEANSDVIRAAVQQRTRLLQPHQLGPDRDAANKLLQEVAKASSCLLSPSSKVDYDHALRARLDGSGSHAIQPVRPQPSGVPALKSADVSPQQAGKVPTLEAKPLIDTGGAGSGAISGNSRSGTIPAPVPVWQRPAVIIPVAAVGALMVVVMVLVVAMRPKKTEVGSISQPRRTASSQFFEPKKTAEKKNAEKKTVKSKDKPAKKPAIDASTDPAEENPLEGSGESPFSGAATGNGGSEGVNPFGDGNPLGAAERPEKPPQPSASNSLGLPGSKPTSDSAGNPVGGSRDSSTQPGPTPSGLATDSVSLDLMERIARYAVELPAGMKIDSLALKITDVRNFPPTKMITPNSTAVAGKDVLFALVDESSRVKFRVRVMPKEGKPFVEVRSTFLNIRGSSPLTEPDLTKAVVATDKKIENDLQRLANYQNLYPQLQRQAIAARQVRSCPPGLAAKQAGIADSRVRSCGNRIKDLQRSIPKDRKRSERLKELQKTVKQLHQIASVRFELISVEVNEDE